jgi:hypothetical protein
MGQVFCLFPQSRKWNSAAGSNGTTTARLKKRELTADQLTSGDARCERRPAKAVYGDD